MVIDNYYQIIINYYIQLMYHNINQFYHLQLLLSNIMFNMN